VSAAKTGEPALAAEGVVAGYLPGVDILRGVDLHVLEGEVVTLVGPNGAGKSTLLKAIFGLLPPRSGKIVLKGADISGERPHVITRKGVAYVPQLDNVFESLSVEENLELGAIGVGLRSPKERIGRMYELFPRLKERRRQSAGTMSGGERQMLAMARTLVPEPDVLLLDEPSAGLAPAFVEAIFETVADINRTGVTVLMVEQNARRALAMSDRGYVLDLGTNRFEGAGRDLIDDPHVAELYFGGAASTAGGRNAASEVAAAQGAAGDEQSE
jgi:neutral amino acid transport system ATP-binding protein